MIKNTNKLYKYHYIYIFNKPILIISVIIIIIITLLVISTINQLKNQSNELIISLFNETINGYIKIIAFVISTLIIGYSFTSENDYYYVYIINNKIDKLKFFISKLIFLIIYLSLILGITLIIIIICKYIYLNKVTIDIFIIYKNIYLKVLIYMLISLVFITLFDYFYLMIILLIIFIIIDDLTIVNYIINNVFIYFAIFLLLLIIGIDIYINKDYK